MARIVQYIRQRLAALGQPQHERNKDGALRNMDTNKSSAPTYHGHNFQQLRVVHRNGSYAPTISELTGTLTHKVGIMVRRKVETGNIEWEDVRYRNAVEGYLRKHHRVGKTERIEGVAVIVMTVDEALTVVRLEHLLRHICSQIREYLRTEYTEHKVDDCLPKWWGERSREEIEVELNSMLGRDPDAFVPFVPYGSDTRCIPFDIVYKRCVVTLSDPTQPDGVRYEMLEWGEYKRENAWYDAGREYRRILPRNTPEEQAEFDAAVAEYVAEDKRRQREYSVVATQTRRTRKATLTEEELNKILGDG